MLAASLSAEAGGSGAACRALPALGIGVTDEAVTRRCEWCERKIVARNRNGVGKRYCGRLCKAAFQSAAVKIARLLIEAGQLSTADLKATLQTAAEARRAEISAGEPEW